jgi:small subunit ribosomal protein S16
MVRLKLRRVGMKKQASYRLEAAEAKGPRDGRFIEILGHYNPRTEPPTISFQEEKILKWLKNGAQPTESVKQLLVTCGIWAKHDPRPVPQKKGEPKKKEEAPAEVKA